MNQEKIDKLHYLNLIIEWFYKTGDEFIVGEETILNFNTEKIAKILNIKDSKYMWIQDYLCDGYIINSKQAETLQIYMTHKFYLAQYVYFISRTN